MTSEEPGRRRRRVSWLAPRSARRPIIRRYDVTVTGGLVVGYLATFVIPRRLDPWLAGRMASIFMRLRRSRVARSEATIRAGLGTRAESIDLERAVRGFYTAKAEYAVARARGMHLGAWNPEIEVEGREFVDAALAQGNGAILWRMDMGDTTVLQRAAWQSGWPLVQLSSAIHGVANSALGARIGAPLYARPEGAYLVERVKIPADWSVNYLPRLFRALKQNQVVAILGEVVGRQNIVVPLLAGRRPLPTGAPGIAHRTGATLIPAATFREGPWRYGVRLGPPIEVDRSLPRGEATELAVAEFGRRLEAAVAEHPGDWNGWWRLLPADSQSPASQGDAEASEPQGNVQASESQGNSRAAEPQAD